MTTTERLRRAHADALAAEGAAWETYHAAQAALVAAFQALQAAERQRDAAIATRQAAYAAWMHPTMEQTADATEPEPVAVVAVPAVA